MKPDDGVVFLNADLQPHPLALLIPEMLQDEYIELLKDIKAHGLQQPITVYEGKILDGRHRHKACIELGKEPKTVDFDGDEAAAKAFVESINVHRRHLTHGQKQKIIEAELKRDPEQSDRAIAKKAKVSQPTVSTKRKKMVADGDVQNSFTSKDALGRKQPRQRKPKATESPPEPSFPRPHAHVRADLDAGVRKFSAFMEKHLDPLPPSEQIEWARKWVACLSARYLTERDGQTTTEANDGTVH